MLLLCIHGKHVLFKNLSFVKMVEQLNLEMDSKEADNITSIHSYISILFPLYIIQ